MKDSRKVIVDVDGDEDGDKNDVLGNTKDQDMSRNEVQNHQAGGSITVDGG